MIYLIAALSAAVIVLVCMIGFLWLSNKKRCAGSDDAQPVEDLSDVAARVSHMAESDDVYKAIGDEVYRICGQSFVLVTAYDKMYDQNYFKAICGVSGLVQKGLQLVAADYVNAPFKLDGDAEANLMSGRLREVDGGLYRITSGKVLKEICEDIEGFFKMEKFYAMGFVRNGVRYGNVVIIPLYGHKIPDKKYVEAVVNLITEAVYGKIGNS